MSEQNRRAFLQTSAVALAAGLIPLDGLSAGATPRSVSSGLAPQAPALPANEGKKPLRLGLIIAIGRDPDAALTKVHDLGLPTAQIFVDQFEPGLVERLQQALEKH